MAKVARQLSKMPKVRERLATGGITPDHANMLASAAEKVGPNAVEVDDRLLETATQLLPDSFDRHSRRWSHQKLIERGVDPLERQRRAREAKLWVEKETGLGVLMAKVPRPSSNISAKPLTNGTSTTCARMAPTARIPMRSALPSSVWPMSCTNC